MLGPVHRKGKLQTAADRILGFLEFSSLQGPEHEVKSMAASSVSHAALGRAWEGRPASSRGARGEQQAAHNGAFDHQYQELQITVGRHENELRTARWRLLS